jgi:serine protease AprX
MLTLINAQEAWLLTRGESAVIAIVDTGIAGGRPEFPPAKRRGQWSPIGDDAWQDDRGHGTMCACIASATRAAGGEFDGVAPDASLLSCKTDFWDSELTTIYDFLGDFAEENETLVIASNSWGYETGEPPPANPGDDFPQALDDALSRGVIAIFSAGNDHALAGGTPDGCTPTSIWQHKCRDDVFTVANSNPEGSMWPDSSRGPGEQFGQPGTDFKPDVNAPTPPNGRVLWGDTASNVSEWGTSGACPQAAGLVALALSLGVKDRTQIFTAIREAAVTLGLDPACQGRGRINCRATLEALGAAVP